MKAQTNSQPRSDREAALRRATVKATRRLVPFLVLMYMLSYLDRANIGFAKQAFQAATGVSDVAFYLPTQIGNLLHVKVGLLVGLVSALPWACAVLTAVILPPLAVRTDCRRAFAVAALLAIAFGLTASGNLAPLPAIVALCFVTMGIICVQPIFWTYSTGYLGGTAAAGGLAVINAIGNLGGFVAPNVKTWAEASFQTASAGLYVLALASFVAAVLFVLLRDGTLFGPQVATARSVG